ncbi:hypothetical protein C0991_012136, partial [Blastosporella zonata]
KQTLDQLVAEKHTAQLEAAEWKARFKTLEQYGSSRGSSDSEMMIPVTALPPQLAKAESPYITFWHQKDFKKGKKTSSAEQSY